MRSHPTGSRHRAATALAALLGAALLLPAAAGAVTCTVDAVPAATLLLPYFEVDLDDPNGLTTLFAVRNAAAEAVLAHVAVWSDLAVPVANFNVYLTGYDAQSFNLRDLLVHGSVPRTAASGQDPDDTISPKGRLSEDAAFPSCAGLLPPAPMSADLLAHLQSALTGRPSPLASGLCLGRNLGDRVARGYVTIDTVRDCTLRYPGDAGYFAAGGAGDATDQNVLWGGWHIVDSAHDVAEGGNLVAIEADAGNPATSTAGRYTFYGRYDGWTGIDHREPLATGFASQFAFGGPFSAIVDLIVWRDPKVAQQPFPCPVKPGTSPAWYPMIQEGFGLFDEEEHPIVTVAFPFEAPPFVPLMPFPAAAQRTRLGGSAFPVPYNFGWLYFDLNSIGFSVQRDPASDPASAQAWVIAVLSSKGRFATGIDAYRLDSACAPFHGQGIPLYTGGPGAPGLSQPF